MPNRRQRRCALARPLSIRCAVLTLALLVASLSAPGQSVLSGYGSVSGSITDSQGNAVVALVWAIRTFSATPTSAPITNTAEINPLGQYRFLSLAPGSYRICVDAIAAGFLDPCQWSDNPPVINLVAGQAATVNVALNKGSFVHVRIDDPNGSATTLEKTVGGPALTVQGRSASGRLVYFPEVARDASGRNYRALIRVGETLQVTATSRLTVNIGPAAVSTTTSPTTNTVSTQPTSPPTAVSTVLQISQSDQAVRFSVQ